MSFKKFLLSRAFFLNLTIAIIIVAGLLFITLKVLNTYTRHGQSNPVPNFRGMVKAEAENIAKQNHLKIEIIDSIHTDKVAPGEIIDQIPEAGFGVKNNRTIFLTINSTQKEMVILPKLTDISFRQAQVLVENSGLLVGQIFYQPSEYNDLVLKVEQDSAQLLEGDVIEKGSRIDFIVGRDAENENTPLPNVEGLKIDEARKIITDARLNFGVLIYDESIISGEDSLNAIIWRQRPDTRINSSVELGTSVDLWITVDKEKINAISGQEL